MSALFSSLNAIVMVIYNNRPIADMFFNGMQIIIVKTSVLRHHFKILCHIH